MEFLESHRRGGGGRGNVYNLTFHSSAESRSNAHKPARATDRFTPLDEDDSKQSRPIRAARKRANVTMPVAFSTLWPRSCGAVCSSRCWDETRWPYKSSRLAYRISRSGGLSIEHVLTFPIGALRALLLTAMHWPRSQVACWLEMLVLMCRVRVDIGSMRSPTS